ncbi:MAG: histidine phosphatase family protein [Bacteroidales bacterium]
MTAYKHLYIVRHGKSDRDFIDVPDFDRPLKERGIIDSYKMASVLLQKKITPQLFITSPAIRALHTATIFARTFKFPLINMNINEDLYMSSESKYLEIIKDTDNSIDSMMIFGHNPSFTDLANYFLHDKIEELPTSGVVGIKFENDSWKNIAKFKPIEYFFDYPKK